MAKRKTYKDIKKIIESEPGWKLETTKSEFIQNNMNTHSILKMKCPNGHQSNKSFNSFFGKQQNRCRICAGNAPLTYIHIKEYYNKYNYKLLTGEEEFIKYNMNSRSGFNVECPNGHTIISKFNHFSGKQKVRCSKCYNNRRHIQSKKLSFEEIKHGFENNTGYILLTLENQFNNDKMNVLHKYDLKCPNRHLVKISYNKFQQGRRCAKCFGKFPLTYEKVKFNFENNTGYKLLTTEKEFVNNNMSYMSKYDVMCLVGHKIKKMYSNFVHKTKPSGCKICANINNSGENSSCWNPFKKEYEIFCSPIRTSLLTMINLKPNIKYTRATEILLNISKNKFDLLMGIKENYNKLGYDLDHIIPKVAFWDYGLTDKKYIKIINHPDNLQYLLHSKNCAKGGIYDDFVFFKFLEKHHIELNELKPKTLKKIIIFRDYINIKYLVNEGWLA